MSSDLLKSCKLCPRACGVNREIDERGFCQAGARLRVAQASLHLWEEPPFVGEVGAGTVFFSHCSLRCVFCQNSVISSMGEGIEISEERLAEIFLELEEKNAATIDLVSPTHYAPQIVKALIIAKKKGLHIPVVWNSSGYESVRTIDFVAPYVDVFLPDFKYYSSELAKRYSLASDYFDVACAAIERMYYHKGSVEFSPDGVMTKGVLVRHLVLPGARKDSMEILSYLWGRFQNDIYLSLMRQYVPLFKAKAYKEINRYLTTFEYEKVVSHAQNLGFVNVFVQEKGSASEAYVPAFDGRGVRVAMLEK